MKLTAESLRLCDGDGYDYQGIESLREVVRFPALEGTGKKRNCPTKEMGKTMREAQEGSRSRLRGFRVGTNHQSRRC